MYALMHAHSYIFSLRNSIAARCVVPISSDLCAPYLPSSCLCLFHAPMDDVPVSSSVVGVIVPLLQRETIEGALA